MAADDVALPAHQLTDVQTTDVAAEGVDHPDELMADDKRHRYRTLRPFVPLVDVHIGAADGGLEDADQHFVAPDRGSGTSTSSRPGPAAVFTNAFMRCSPS